VSSTNTGAYRTNSDFSINVNEIATSLYWVRNLTARIAPFLSGVNLLFVAYWPVWPPS
jgi:hypothetical protein